MKKSIIAIFALTTLVFAGFYFLADKKTGGTESEPINPEFKEYISAYTSGYVNKSAKIRIVLQEKSAKAGEANTLVKNSLFKFSPDIEGSIVWLDESTIEFRPAEKLKNGQEYEVEFFLGEVLEVNDALEKFPFVFKTIPQAMDVEVTNYMAADKNSSAYHISGIVSTADECKHDLLEKTLQASHNGETKSIVWEHENPTTHRFTIQNVKRGSDYSELKISYTAAPIDGDQNGETQIAIPAKNKFSVMDVKVTNGADQQVTVFFSDIPSAEQNMNGMFTLHGNRAANFSTEANVLNIFPSMRLEGKKTLEISSELISSASGKLSGLRSFEVTFNELKPEIKFEGKGNIIPTGDQLLLPFSAVNLRAVDVKIKKIYEKKYSSVPAGKSP